MLWLRHLSSRISKADIFRAKYQKYLLVIIALSLVLGMSQIFRYKYQDDLSQCIKDITSLSDQKETMHFEIWQNQFANLGNEVSRLNLLMAETRARLRLTTDSLIQGIPQDNMLKERIREVQPFVGSELKSTSGLNEVRIVMEKHAKTIAVLQTKISNGCDQSDAMMQWLSFLEGLVSLIIAIIAFYAGRKSLA